MLDPHSYTLLVLSREIKSLGDKFVSLKIDSYHMMEKEREFYHEGVVDQGKRWKSL